MLLDETQFRTNRRLWIVFFAFPLLLAHSSAPTFGATVDPPEISIGTLPAGTQIPFSVVLRANPGEVLDPNLRLVSNVDIIRWIGFANTGKDRSQEAQFDFEIIAKFPGPFRHSVIFTTGLRSQDTIEVPIRGVITATAHFFYTAEDPDAQSILTLVQQLVANAGTEAITFVPTPLTTPESVASFHRMASEFGLPPEFPQKTTLFLAFRVFSTPSGISAALRNAYSGAPFPESEVPTRFASAPDPAQPGAVPEPAPPTAAPPHSARYVAQVYFRYSCSKCTDALKTFGETMFARHGNKLSLIEFSTFDLDKPDVVEKIKTALGDRPYPEEPESMFVATGELGSNLQLVPGSLALLDGLGSAIDKIVADEGPAEAPPSPAPVLDSPQVRPRTPALPEQTPQQQVLVGAEPVSAASLDSSAPSVVTVPPYPPPPAGGSGVPIFAILAAVIGGIIVLMLILVEGRLRRIEEALGLGNRGRNDHSGPQNPS